MKAECPRCGGAVSTHYKTWKLKSGNTVYMFACPRCGSRFRKVVTNG